MLLDVQNAITSRLLQNHLIAGTAQLGKRPSYISSRSFTLALFDVLAPANPAQPRTVQDFKNGVAALPDPRLRATVLGLLTLRSRTPTWHGKGWKTSTTT